MTTLAVVLAIFCALMIILQITIAVRSRRLQKRRLQRLGGPLGEAVASGDRLLAYFYSPSCTESRQQTPIIDTLQGEYENIFKVDVGEHFDAARAFGVKTTPTPRIVEGGKVVEVLIGPRNEDRLREALL
ncbi:MAG: thioredoxin family protein [Bacteroidetes bacterium]|nr:thioredoxin family protein [Bacteroidota bacterium]